MFAIKDSEDLAPGFGTGAGSDCEPLEEAPAAGAGPRAGGCSGLLQPQQKADTINKSVKIPVAHERRRICITILIA